MQARSKRLVDDILQAAIQVLVRDGARRFTTARVAEVAGVSIGSLYQYFPNKASILFRLQLDEWRTTSSFILDILEDAGLPPFVRLRSAVAAFLRSECQEAPIRTALADATPLFRDAPELATHRRAAMRRFLGFFREATPGVPRERRARAADLVFTTVEAIGKRISEERREPAEVEACATALGDMLCAYLGQLGRPAP